MITIAKNITNLLRIPRKGLIAACGIALTLSTAYAVAETRIPSDADAADSGDVDEDSAAPTKITQQKPADEDERADTNQLPQPADTASMGYSPKTTDLTGLGRVSAILPAVSPSTETPHAADAVLITIQEAVTTSIQRNKLLAVRTFDPGIARGTVLNRLGKFDSNFTLQLNHNHNEIPTSSSLGGANVAINTQKNWNLAYNDTLMQGATYSLQFNNARNENNSSFNTLNPNFNSNIFGNVTQPLLKNFGKHINLTQVIIARNGVKQNYWRLKKTAIDTVSNTEQSFWELVFARQDREVKRWQVNAAHELLVYNKGRSAAGLGSDVQVVQAQTTEAASMLALDLAERSLLDNQEILRQLLSLNREAGVEIVPVGVSGIPPHPINLNEALRVAFLKRPDYLDALIDIRSKHIQVLFAKNQLLPQVDLVASYQQNGLAPTYAEDLDQVGIASFQGYTVGVNVTIPFSNRVARGNLAISELAKRQAILNVKAVEDQVKSDVTRAVRALSTDLKRVEVGKLNAHFSAKQLQAGEAQYQQGVISNFDLIRFQQDLANARSNALRAVADAMKSGIAVEAATGTILERRGIAVGEMEARKLGGEDPLPIRSDP